MDLSAATTSESKEKLSAVQKSWLNKRPNINIAGQAGVFILLPFYLRIVLASWYKIEMKDSLERNKIKLEKGAAVATRWIGSTTSLITHTILFLFAFIIPLFGIPFERVLLVLTTIVSLEAIYLSIFIQMSVNKNTQDIELIQEDVGEIQEDVEEIEKDVDEIQKDVDEIQEDIEDIEEDDVEEVKQEQQEQAMLLTIQETLKKLSKEIETLKK